ncbi:MAG: hypothetical protein AAGI03_00750 [Pseudomonadota bacterium]
MAVFSAIASVASSRSQSKAASQQAAVAAAAAANELELQEKIYDQTRADTASWRDAGEFALSAIRESYPEGLFDPSVFDFEPDPGYQFRKDEGSKAIMRSAAAQGDRFAPSTMKELARYNSDLASQEYQAAWNRNQVAKGTNFNQLATLAGLGQTGVSQVAAAGQNYANQGSNAIRYGAAAQADAYGRQGAAQAQMYGGLATAGRNAISNALSFGALF